MLNGDGEELEIPDDWTPFDDKEEQVASNCNGTPQEEWPIPSTTIGTTLREHDCSGDVHECGDKENTRILQTNNVWFIGSGDGRDVFGEAACQQVGSGLGSGLNQSLTQNRQQNGKENNLAVGGFLVRVLDVSKRVWRRPRGRTKAKSM